jgi:hypothetical protein
VAKPKKTEKADRPGDEKTPAGTPESTKAAEEAAERKFVEDTLIRGEAAEPDEKGKLPPDATHEIVEEHEGEPPTIKRRRFKAF